MYYCYYYSPTKRPRGDGELHRGCDRDTFVELRTISEAPVPEYGGDPNLCADLY